MAEASYRLEVARSAERDLRRMVAGDRQRVIAAVQALGAEPRPQGCQKMTDREEYRIRVGDYRVMYTIDDRARVVIIYRAAHRRDVYR